jgi:di/tricarboxylate transporter
MHYGVTPAHEYLGTGYMKQGNSWTIGMIARILNILIRSTVGVGWEKLLGWW